MFAFSLIPFPFVGQLKRKKIPHASAQVKTYGAIGDGPAQKRVSFVLA
jgi:hypothetical protein